MNNQYIGSKNQVYNAPKGSFHSYVRRNISTAADNKRLDFTPISFTSRTRIKSTKTARTARENTVHIRSKQQNQQNQKQDITFYEYMMRLQAKGLQAHKNHKNIDMNQNKDKKQRKHRHLKSKRFQNRNPIQRLRLNRNLQQQSSNQKKQQNTFSRNKLLSLKQELGLGTIASCLPFFRINIQNKESYLKGQPLKIKTDKFKLIYPLVQLNKQFYSQSVREKTFQI